MRELIDADLWGWAGWATYATGLLALLTLGSWLYGRWTTRVHDRPLAPPRPEAEPLCHPGHVVLVTDAQGHPATRPWGRLRPGDVQMTLEQASRAGMVRRA